MARLINSHKTANNVWTTTKNQRQYGNKFYLLYLFGIQLELYRVKLEFSIEVLLCL